LRETVRWLVSFGKRRRLPRSSTSRVSHSENEYPRRCEIIKVSGRMCHARRWSSTSLAISIHGNRDLWNPGFSNGNRARLHFLGARDHRTSIRQEAAARGRKRRSASVALKQLHIKGPLECLDRVTDRRLCTVQLACRPGKASLVTHGNEGPKLIDRDVIEHTYLKSRCYISIFS
jgi:hypothetical protein